MSRSVLVETIVCLPVCNFTNYVVLWLLTPRLFQWLARLAINESLRKSSTFDGNRMLLFQCNFELAHLPFPVCKDDVTRVSTDFSICESSKCTTFVYTGCPIATECPLVS